jgi:hypothetical protein
MEIQTTEAKVIHAPVSFAAHNRSTQDKLDALVIQVQQLQDRITALEQQ